MGKAIITIAKSVHVEEGVGRKKLIEKKTSARHVDYVWQKIVLKSHNQNQIIV